MAQPKAELQQRPEMGRTSVEKEQRIVDAIVQQLPERKTERSESLRQARRKAIATGDAAQSVSVALREAQLRQIERMENGMPPYFARVVGQFRAADGELFEEEVRVHAFPYFEEWDTPEGRIAVVSQRAGIAAVVRDPTVKEYELNEADRVPGVAVRQSRVEPVNVLVEDIEIRDGRVVSISERYGEVWQERVKGKLAEVGNPHAEFLWEVLDHEQGRVINERPEGYRALLIDGPAGTGKTLIALHYVVVHAGVGKTVREAEREPAHVWFITPTPALARRMSPAVQMGAPAAINWRVVSLWEIVRALVPELPDLFDWEETELAGHKARDEQFVETIVHAYRAAVGKALQAVQRFLHTAADIVARSVPEAAHRLDRLSIRIGGREERVNIREAIDGLASNPAFRETAQALFVALQARVEHDEVAKAFLRREQLDSLLAACDANLWYAYQAGLTTYEQARSIRQSGARRLRVEDLGPLLAVARRIGRTLNWPAPQWVILDEVQSFSPVALRALRELLPAASRLILAGDMNQQLTRESGIRSYEEALQALDIRHEALRSVRLDRPYRTPPEILRHGHRLLRPDDTPTVNPLHPEPGEVITRIVEQGPSLVRAVTQVIHKARREGLPMIAVLCPNLRRAHELMEEVKRELDASGAAGGDEPQLLTGAESYQGRLAFGTIEAFQGLEADVVIIPDVTNQAYPDDSSGWARRRLYTAVTRARKRVVILAVREPSRTLMKCQDFVRECVRIAYRRRRAAEQEHHRSGEGKPVLLSVNLVEAYGLAAVATNDERTQDAFSVRPSPILALKHQPVFLPFSCQSSVAGVVEQDNACFAGADDWESPAFTVGRDDNKEIVLIWAYRRVSGREPFRLEVLDPKGLPLTSADLERMDPEGEGMATLTIRRAGAYRLRVRAPGIAWAVVAGGWKDQ